MAAPTLVNSVEISTPWALAPNVTAGVLTKDYAAALTVAAGDLIVALQGMATDNQAGTSISLSGSLNGAYTQQTTLISANQCPISIESKSSAAGTETLTFARQSGTLSGEAGGAAFQFRDHGGVGNVFAATLGVQSGSLSCSANSALLVLVLDWNATTGTRTWANIDGAAPTATGGVAGDGATWAAAWAYYADVGAAGSKTFTLTAPTFGAPVIAAIEVLGSPPPGANAPTYGTDRPDLSLTTDDPGSSMLTNAAAWW